MKNIVYKIQIFPGLLVLMQKNQFLKILNYVGIFTINQEI